MTIKEPDKRLRDVEVLLRCMSFLKYAKDYKGNLLQFLDNTMHIFNVLWKTEETEIKALERKVMDTIHKLIEVLVLVILLHESIKW